MHGASAQFLHQRSGLRLLSSITQTMLQETSQCPFPYTSLLMNELFPALPEFTGLRRRCSGEYVGLLDADTRSEYSGGKGLLEMDFLY